MNKRKMMGAARRRKDDPKLALAKAQVRGLRAIVKAGQEMMRAAGAPAPYPHGGEPRFVQCWAVQRGGFSAVTQALDELGHVWERVSLMGEAIVNDKKVKVLQDSWWEPLSMERRDAKKEDQT